MKIVKICLSFILLLMCVGCNTDKQITHEFLLMGTIKDEDYPIEKDSLGAKLLFYPHATKIIEVSLVVEEISSQTIVFKKTISGEQLVEENVCEIKAENENGRFMVSFGFNGEFEKADIDQECAYMFVESYHTTQEETGGFDLLQFLEYRANVSDEVDLFSMHVFQSDKQYMVKLLAS